MLTGVRIYSSDAIWKQILAEFGATVLDAPSVTAVDFDKLGIKKTISPLELKEFILNETDNTEILKQIFGKNMALSQIQERIVVMLFKSGGMNLTELKSALGYAPDVATHAVDAAMSGLRRVFGRDFITNDNGVYKIGKL